MFCSECFYKQVSMNHFCIEQNHLKFSLLIGSQNHSDIFSSNALIFVSPVRKCTSCQEKEWHNADLYAYPMRYDIQFFLTNVTTSNWKMG
jgi:hypothetical protein